MREHHWTNTFLLTLDDLGRSLRKTDPCPLYDIKVHTPLWAPMRARVDVLRWVWEDYLKEQQDEQETLER